MLRPPPRFTLFPYTTLFRSERFSGKSRIGPINADGGQSIASSHEPLWVIVNKASPVRATPRPRSKISQTDPDDHRQQDRKSTRLNSSHVSISYAVFCLKKKT